ncbi:hypothetical protein [Ruegeria atlantica]|uniref:hypothetical protein n=1 Tax=Ruegeria atlantica TaxID=81569 RepID=UPI00147D4D84|nr:hypothetical protein [Ruegeria atlantica]
MPDKFLETDPDLEIATADALPHMPLNAALSALPCDGENPRLTARCRETVAALMVPPGTPRPIRDLVRDIAKNPDDLSPFEVFRVRCALGGFRQARPELYALVKHILVDLFGVPNMTLTQCAHRFRNEESAARKAMKDAAKNRDWEKLLKLAHDRASVMGE